MNDPHHPDPRVHRANQKAAVWSLTEATERREAIDQELYDLDQQPGSLAKVTRQLSLRFQRSCAERAERHALAYAQALGAVLTPDEAR